MKTPLVAKVGESEKPFACIMILVGLARLNKRSRLTKLFHIIRRIMFDTIQN